MVCLRWRPYLLAAFAAAATERVSGPALGVVLYSGNGSSAAVKVAAALTVQYFPPHAEVRHYLCTDARSAAAVRDSLGNGTVLTTFPEVDQDAKFLHCVQRVREPAVLLVMDDWWLIAPVDADVLVAAAQLVGSPSGPRKQRPTGVLGPRAARLRRRSDALARRFYPIRPPAPTDDLAARRAGRAS